MSAEINKSEFSKNDKNSLNIHIALDGIDYEEIVKFLLSQVLKGIQKKDVQDPVKMKKSDKFLLEVFDVIGDEQDAIISSVLGRMNDEKKSKIACLVVEEYNDKICKILNKKIVSKSPVKGLEISAIQIGKWQ